MDRYHINLHRWDVIIEHNGQIKDKPVGLFTINLDQVISISIFDYNEALLETEYCDWPDKIKEMVKGKGVWVVFTFADDYKIYMGKKYYDDEEGAEQTMELYKDLLKRDIWVTQ